MSENKPTTGLKDYPYLRKNDKQGSLIHPRRLALLNPEYFPCNARGEFPPHIVTQLGLGTKESAVMRVPAVQPEPVVVVVEQEDVEQEDIPEVEATVDEAKIAEDKIRMKAKELGIKYWHNRKIENLMPLVQEAMDKE